MKNKTDAMNSYSAEQASDGYETLSNADVACWRDRKNRQEKWANTYGNDAMNFCEGTEEIKEEKDGGFLPRRNYQDRF